MGPCRCRGHSKCKRFVIRVVDASVQSCGGQSKCKRFVIPVVDASVQSSEWSTLAFMATVTEKMGSYEVVCCSEEG